ncbi:hypothetical protein E2C01_012881 [Portunus trituberculatus]|uniref:Uncharacterized protein n=1 Tax=Portunus trituberculatus TaxID=210409 RepID=A0A5B7DET1_PORTR|nr:hypothetical protein [Portunus trituberculatus]
MMKDILVSSSGEPPAPWSSPTWTPSRRAFHFFRKRSKYLSYILPRANRLRQQREQQLQRDLQMTQRDHDPQVTHTETQEELCSSSYECEIISTPAQIHKRNSV